MAQEPRKPMQPTLAQDADMQGIGDKDGWTMPSNLTAPPPNPGMGQRWVRTGIQGTEDVTNYAKYINEGWTPRRAETARDYHPPTIKHGENAGFIGIHGMILMEMPLARIEARKKYFEGRTSLMTDAVDNDILKVESREVPFHRQRRTTTTKGRRPSVADD